MDGSGSAGSTLFDALADEAHARTSDPDTSHAAADSVGELRPKQQAVLDALRAIGPATDERIADLYPHVLPYQSPSGLRTRRAELVAAGLVKDSGRREPLASGRSAIVWEAVA